MSSSDVNLAGIITPIGFPGNIIVFPNIDNRQFIHSGTPMDWHQQSWDGSNSSIEVKKVRKTTTNTNEAGKSGTQLGAPPKREIRRIRKEKNDICDKRQSGYQ
jgi:hypothetical protein